MIRLISNVRVTVSETLFTNNIRSNLSYSSSKCHPPYQISIEKFTIADILQRPESITRVQDPTISSYHNLQANLSETSENKVVKTRYLHEISRLAVIKPFLHLLLQNSDSGKLQQKFNLFTYLFTNTIPT